MGLNILEVFQFIEALILRNVQITTSLASQNLFHSGS